MGKYAPDATLDTILDYVALSDYICVCSGSPTTFAAAYTDNMLARTGVDAGDFTKADDTSGRKVTIGAQADIAITNSGTALAIALVETAGSTLRWTTTCTSQAIVAGGTVSIPEFKISISDPT